MAWTPRAVFLAGYESEVEYNGGSDEVPMRLCFHVVTTRQPARDLDLMFFTLSSERGVAVTLWPWILHVGGLLDAVGVCFSLESFVTLGPSGRFRRRLSEKCECW